MYEALVARVRYHIQKANFMGLKQAESTLLLGEAADAIQELQQTVEHYHGCMNDWFEAAQEYKAAYIAEHDARIAESKPRWISVTERLPEKTDHYLVRVKCGRDGEIVSAWEQVAWFCKKFYWEHLHGDDVFEETITHWMPLPQAPKEET